MFLKVFCFSQAENVCQEWSLSKEKEGILEEQTLQNYAVYNVWQICGYYGDSSERDTFCGDFMVNLIWRFSCGLIYHAFLIKTQENLQTNSTYISIKSILLNTISM